MWFVGSNFFLQKKDNVENFIHINSIDSDTAKKKWCKFTTPKPNKKNNDTTIAPSFQGVPNLKRLFGMLVPDTLFGRSTSFPLFFSHQEIRTSFFSHYEKNKKLDFLLAKNRPWRRWIPCLNNAVITPLQLPRPWPGSSGSQWQKLPVVGYPWVPLKHSHGVSVYLTLR